MRPVLVNSEDSRGGAARAVYRLHAGLKSIGVDSSMLVQVKHGEDPSVFGPRTGTGQLAARLRQVLDLLPVLAYPADGPGGRSILVGCRTVLAGELRTSHRTWFICTGLPADS